MDTYKFNKAVKDWSRITLAELQKSFAKYDIQHRKNSSSKTAALKELRNHIGFERGLANRTSFKFPQHMVYVHKGVGKGVSVAEAAMSNRKAKPWFNEVVDAGIERLADAVAEEAADMLVDATRFGIK